MPQEVTSVPMGLYSTPKADFLQNRRQLIIDMKYQIKSLEKKKNKMAPESFEYKQTEKAIARRHKIIKNCEQDIYVTQMQINIQTNARYRGL